MISAAKTEIIIGIEAQIRNKNAPNKNQPSANDENKQKSIFQHKQL